MVLKGYITTLPLFGENVPQSVQNLVIRDYCQKNKLDFLLSAVEYNYPKKHLVLKTILNDLNKLDGIVFYSLFQLPSNNTQRKSVFSKVIDNKKEMHFALENIVVKKLENINRVENIWKVRATISSCPSGELIRSSLKQVQYTDNNFKDNRNGQH